MQRGYIDVVFGPMFSGKSSELFRKVRRFNHAQKNCLVVNYSFDNRYSNEQMACTHDQQMLKAIKIQNLNEIDTIYQRYDVIAIDEGQFFPNIAEKAEFLANKGKIVIIAALDGTFERKPFGQILSLVPLAENVTKLQAVCVNCQKDASFTARLSDSKEVELIGGDELYKPLCRSCFLIHKDKSSDEKREQFIEVNITNQKDAEKSMKIDAFQTNREDLGPKQNMELENMKKMIKSK